MSTIRSLADFDLRGSLVFGKNFPDFPPNPRSGQTNLINGVVWVYTTIDGVQTWYPLTNKKNSFVHIQAVASFQWVINHGLGTPNVLFAVYDDNGVPLVVSMTTIDDNSFRLNFTSAVTGRCVVFADSERYASNIEAATITASAVTVAGGAVVLDSTGVKVGGFQVALLDATGVLQASQVPTIGWDKLADVPTTIGGYGITDAYTRTEIDGLLADAAPGSSSQDFASQNLTVSSDATVGGDLAVIGNGSFAGNLTIDGNLVVTGTHTTVDTQNTLVRDNIVVYNNGEVGAGVTNQYSGIEIDRGTLADQRLVFDELDDQWKVGEVGSEEALVTLPQADARYLQAGMIIDGGEL